MKRSFLLLLCCLVVTDHCLAQAGPPPVPIGPLGNVDIAFLNTYTSIMRAITASHPPYVEISGSNLILNHNGNEESIRVLPDIYHALKDVAHVPFMVYLELAPLAADGRELTDVKISELELFVSKIASARNALQTGHFNDDQLSRQQRMIDKSIELLRTTIQSKNINRVTLEDFTHTMGPLMMENSDEAGCYQVQSTHDQMMKWKKVLTADEWNRLVAVNIGGHQARYRNVASQYFGWLFTTSAPQWAYPGESARVIYAESLPKMQNGGDELVSTLIDADASDAFLGNRWRLSEDILSDGAARCIAQLPVADKVWH